jgi:hypothetical protein
MSTTRNSSKNEGEEEKCCGFKEMTWWCQTLFSLFFVRRCNSEELENVKNVGPSANFQSVPTKRRGPIKKDQNLTNEK